MNRIKELRTARKLNQSQLAHIIGIAQPTLSGWETGRTQIDYDNLIKLANFFETTIDHLLGMPSNMTSRVLPQYMPADTSAIDKYFQEMAERDDTEYALKGTDDIKIVMQLTAVLKHADEETKKAIYEYLQTSPETKKALSPVVAITQNKK